MSVRLLLLSVFFFISGELLAAGQTQALGDVAANVVDSMSSIVRLITAASYVAGMGFALAGIVKFKSHRDNPQQVPLSAPIVLLVIGTALLFFPSILTTAGSTMFGTDQKAGNAGGFVSVDGFID